MNLLYDVVISGKILDGFSRDQVIDNLATSLDINHRRGEQFLNQKQSVYLKGVSYEEAEQSIQKFTQSGLEAFTMRHLNGEEGVVEAHGLKTELAGGNKQSGSALGGADKTAQDLQQLKRKNFEFTGNGTEYFRIWIVNVMLTIITFGIYSAWAKVRNKQYFYGNTFLDGASFSYRAKPIQILKGRLIAFGFFIIYAVVGNLFPATGALFGLIFFLAFPFLLVKSLAFNAYNSEYRNVRFGFDGKFGGAFAAFAGWPLLGLFTLGILLPYAIHQQQHYIVKNHRYGDTPFKFEASWGAYYKVFLVLIGIVFLIGMLFGLIQQQSISPEEAVVSPVTMFVVGIMTIMLYLLMFVYFNVKMMNLRFNNASLGEHRFEATLKVAGYYGVVLVNTLASVLTLGLFLPWAKVRIAQYKAEHLSMFVHGELDNFSAEVEKRVGSFGEGMADVFDMDIGL